ncbi:MHYT domain-containing signal sensor [Virgisporangium aliadipatigenens]|uniref:MHYT domain-containing signal sensor n=1 Tax=Virgisporangium aliadipatigenens TaxID=741659 RepID=A0A8J4DTN9_9ACTN|nr:MHYT domain-containing signal sensor [Virgisporangium aliadipatigenens]
MGEVHHFTYGWVTPVFAYGLSFLGSMLGLVCTARARVATDNRKRAGLLVLAAWAIGGTGIWVMHFMAMIGFSVSGSEVRYDVPLTVLSFVIAVVMVGVGLFIVGMGKPNALKVLSGGLVAGLSVAAMHYIGMAAMEIDGKIGYDRNLVLGSVAIAVVAATVALWFTLVIRGLGATILAAAVMGVAVCGMHYTGMAAMRLESSTGFTALHGVSVNWFLAPMVLFVLVVFFAMMNLTMAVPTAEEERGYASRQMGNSPA